MRFEIPSTTTGQFTFPNGTVKHYEKGKKQGLVTLPDGTQKWYHNGVLHRDDHPAIVYPNGKTEWYFHGVHCATVWYESKYDGIYSVVHRDPFEGAAVTIYKFNPMARRLVYCYDIWPVEEPDNLPFSVDVINDIALEDYEVDEIINSQMAKHIKRIEEITGKKVHIE